MDTLVTQKTTTYASKAQEMYKQTKGKDCTVFMASNTAHVNLDKM